MKKLIAILLILMVTGVIFSQTTEQNIDDEQELARQSRYDFRETLIDFSQIDRENDPTRVVVYNARLRNTLSPEAQAELDNENINFGLQYWRAIPQSSIRFPEVLASNRVIGVEVQNGGGQQGYYVYPTPGQHVLGVRLKFPPYNFNMYVDIQPPFQPEFNNPDYENFGVLDNVGTVRSAYISLYGLYQQEKIYLVTEDTIGNTYEYLFGAMDFIGWQTLEWVNPSYIEDVRNRAIDYRPLYPRATSQRKYKSLKIERTGLYPTEDFVTYIHKLEFTFDKEINEDLFNEFAHEDTWKIIQEGSFLRQKLSLDRNTTEKYFEYLERRKLYNNKERTGQ